MGWRSPRRRRLQLRRLLLLRFLLGNLTSLLFLRLIVLGILVALLTLVLGFIPLVGGAIATVVGVLLSGRLLARELAGRAFDARGLSHDERQRLLASGRARVLGFGVATQLCYMVPLGAVITMPAAVAGSTMLARTLTDRTASGAEISAPADEVRPAGASGGTSAHA